METEVPAKRSSTPSHAIDGNLNITAARTSVVYVSVPVLCASLIGINSVT